MRAPLAGKPAKPCRESMVGIGWWRRVELEAYNQGKVPGGWREKQSIQQVIEKRKKSLK